ncbi:CAP domain-containing protein [Pedobacter sp. NJ-S-72]
MNYSTTPKWKNSFLMILISCAISISCTKSKDTPTPANSSVLPVSIPEKKNTETNLNNDLFLKLVNDVRIKGCDCKEQGGGITRMPPVPVLAWNNNLAIIAKVHSDDMEKDKYFDHTDMNGKNPGDRMTAAGYLWSAYAENIAMGQRTEIEAFNSWINSDHGHCQNIMSPNIREMGVARSTGNYWTQLFGTRR